MKSELIRKAFHLIGLIYVGGVYFLPRPLFLSLVVSLFILSGLFELTRLKIPAVAEFFNRYLGMFFREQEKARITGVFWMLLGILTTSLLIPPREIAATIFLYVILGDGIASLVGKSLGGPKWPGSDKTISGSLACFVMCGVIGVLMLRPDYHWAGIFLGAFSAAFLEFGLIPLNDNFLIPAGCSVLYALVYGLKPIFIS